MLANSFPSDAVQYAWDLDEERPAAFGGSPDAKRLFGRWRPAPASEPPSSEWQRLSFVINTHYPEVRGGYYVNPRVLLAMQSALERAELRIVDEDLVPALDAGNAPEEHLLSIDPRRSYLLQTTGLPPNVRLGVRLGGRLLKWQFDTGGGGPFFGDGVIVDILILPELGQVLLSEFREVCGVHRIRVDHFQP